MSWAPYDSLNIGIHVGDDIVLVLRNREKLHELISQQSDIVDHRQWIFLNQTHEPTIYNVDGEAYDSLDPPTADAAITTAKNLPLVIMTADCGPLVIAGESILGVVHASWRTVKGGLIEATVSEMLKRAPGQQLNAFLGPCIYPHSYEFDPVELEELSDVLGSHVVSSTSEGKPAFNLPAAIKHACNNAGIDSDEMGINTYGSPNHFSYRRDGVTGRQGVVAWLR